MTSFALFGIAALIVTFFVRWVRQMNRTRAFQEMLVLQDRQDQERISALTSELAYHRARAKNLHILQCKEFIKATFEYRSRS